MSFLARLKQGLGKTSTGLTQGITDIFTKRKLDEETLSELEDLLISADLGAQTSARLVDNLSKSRFGKEVDDKEIKTALAQDIEKILTPVMKPLSVEAAKPFVILVAGVNGAGKTTTIGKLAYSLKAQGKSVLLAAGDTFRAAAVAQLQTWAQRTSCPIVTKEEGADSAALAYEAVAQGLADHHDVVLIDTAGRLQNKSNLMQELEKIVRVVKKQIPEAPHAVLLVLDATTGQNAHAQVEIFQKSVGVTGLIVTKLDGTARGGVVVSLAERFGLPVYAIGIGEGIDDLRPFSAKDFSETLMGL